MQQSAQNKTGTDRFQHPLPARTIFSGLDRPAQQMLGVREILTIGFKHKLLILVMLLIASSVSPVVYYLLPRVYEARAKLMVKPGWEYRYNPEVAILGQKPSSANEAIDSEVQILNSRDVKERVINTLGAARMYPNLQKKSNDGKIPMGEALGEFDENFIVKTSSGSVIDLALQGRNPAILGEALSKLIYFYEIKRMEVFKDPKSVLFLEKQLAEYRQEIRDAENELQSYRESNQIYSLSTQREQLLAQRAELGSSLTTARNQTQILHQKLSLLEKELKKLTENEPMSEALQLSTNQLQAQLLSLQLKEKELLLKYKETNPLVEDVRRQIQLTKEYFEKNKEAKPVSTVYQDTKTEIINSKAELSSLQIEIPLLNKQLEEVNNQLEILNARENKLRELERKRDNLEQSYQAGMHKIEELRVFDDMDRQKMTSVSLLQPAKVSPYPISPSKPLLYFLAVGVFLGLGAGLGTAYLLEIAGQRFTTPQEVEKRLHLPVLATVAHKKIAKRPS